MLKSPSKRFAQTREAHKSEVAEDYVKTILDLIDEDGDAKLTEIANRMGVAHPTAFKALKKLEIAGLVHLEPYCPILLSVAGRALAEACRDRHNFVVKFLLAHGLDRDTAEVDAEGIEHHVSPQTLAMMKAFVERTV